jgi:hypothetical protein
MVVIFSSLLLGGCTGEVQQEGDHGVAVEDTTILPEETGTAAEVPAILEDSL